MTEARIVRRIATVWTDPTAVRDIDAPAVAGDPDVGAWTASMGFDERLDLHGRILTQALPGEPVLVDGERDGWVQIVLPWQPSSLDPRGYPGWVRTEHLADGSAAGEVATAVALPGGPVEPGMVDGAAILATARQFIGLEYLWAGYTGHGVDCSGLASLTHRGHGVVIPRDAHDQAVGGKPVELDALQAGDLVFFGEDRGHGPIHHVGIAVGDGTMLHSPRTGKQVEVLALDTPGYAEELCAARRYV
jgi:cell wall-associated NlpC family hydrolase